MHITGFIAFFSGIASFFSPCILPLIPSYLIFISGVSLDNYSEATMRKYRRTVIPHSLCFIAGFSLVFVSLGLTTSYLARFFADYQVYIMRIGGFLLIVMGLYSLNLIRIPFFDREKAIHLKEKPLGLLGSFLVGITFSLGWTPCVGPALSSILIMAGTSSGVREGAYLLGLYSAGLAIPFFIAALLFHRIFTLFNRFRVIAKYSMKVLGALLVIIGFLIFTDQYGLVTSLMARII